MIDLAMVPSVFIVMLGILILVCAICRSDERKVRVRLEHEARKQALDVQAKAGERIKRVHIADLEAERMIKLKAAGVITMPAERRDPRNTGARIERGRSRDLSDARIAGRLGLSHRPDGIPDCPFSAADTDAAELVRHLATSLCQVVAQDVQVS